MKISSIVILFTFLLGCSLALAQAPADMRNVMLDDSIEFVDENAQQDAVNAAKNLLRTRPHSLRKHNFPKLRQARHVKQNILEEKEQNAPFGLIWGASVTETGNQGIILTPTQDKDYVNTYSAQKLPKPIDSFEHVDLTFGKEDQLWRIIAYGKPLEDTATASEVMREYNFFANLLTKKYGNKQEFFTPAKIDVIKKDNRNRDYVVQEDAPLGNPDFLSQLQQGTATLYSTYHNNEVGAALAISVDGDKKSYIVIDYKNLKILQAQENKTLDAL